MVTTCVYFMKRWVVTFGLFFLAAQSRADLANITEFLTAKTLAAQEQQKEILGVLLDPKFSAETRLDLLTEIIPNEKFQNVIREAGSNEVKFKKDMLEVLDQESFIKKFQEIITQQQKLSVNLLDLVKQNQDLSPEIQPFYQKLDQILNKLYDRPQNTAEKELKYIKNLIVHFLVVRRETHLQLEAKRKLRKEKPSLILVDELCTFETYDSVDKESQFFLEQFDEELESRHANTLAWKLCQFDVKSGSSNPRLESLINQVENEILKAQKLYKRLKTEKPSSCEAIPSLEKMIARCASVRKFIDDMKAMRHEAFSASQKEPFTTGTQRRSMENYFAALTIDLSEGIEHSLSEIQGLKESVQEELKLVEENAKKASSIAECPPPQPALEPIKKEIMVSPPEVEDEKKVQTSEKKEEKKKKTKSEREEEFEVFKVEKQKTYLEKVRERFKGARKRALLELFFNDKENDMQMTYEDIEGLISSVDGYIPSERNKGSHRTIVVPGGVSFGVRPHLGRGGQGQKLRTRQIKRFRRAFEMANLTPEQIFPNESK